MISIICAFVTFATVDSRAFRNQESHGHAVLDEAQLQKTLFEEIESNFASVGKRGRLARLEAALKPLFDTLPKNEHGNLGHNPVRYALHRIFVQRHGWYIKGMEPSGDGWSNTTSPAGVLKDKVSSYVEELFEERLGGRGFNLHDTAVLAATLEHIIHDENKNRLSLAYSDKHFAEDDELSQAQSDTVLDHYMRLHLLTEEMARSVSTKDMSKIFPGWKETQQFVRDIRSEVQKTHPGKHMTFEAMTDVAEEVGERFGHFQDAECGMMKNKLIALGDGGVGRIPLSNFYKASLDGNTFEFQENQDYLRDLGALDESDLNNPSVILPNYIQSATNCIASESLYSVCCLNECEQLMSHLEKEIASPEAKPDRIAALVADLSSSTVEAPRSLPSQLLARLDDAAATHGGTVQLHGRLFGQWMHHAFPRECPFPHVAGSTNPQTPDEWMTESTQSFASKQEMRRYAEMAKTDEPDKAPTELHWIHEEELLVPFPVKPAPTQRSKFWLFSSVLMLSAVFCSVASQALAPVQAAKSALKKSMEGSDEIKDIKEGLSWTEPVKQGSMMRLRSRGDRSFLPA